MNHIKNSAVYFYFYMVVFALFFSSYLLGFFLFFFNILNNIQEGNNLVPYEAINFFLDIGFVQPNPTVLLTPTLQFR